MSGAGKSQMLVFDGAASRWARVSGYCPSGKTLIGVSTSCMNIDGYPYTRGMVNYNGTFALPPNGWNLQCDNETNNASVPRLTLTCQ